MTSSFTELPSLASLGLLQPFPGTASTALFLGLACQAHRQANLFVKATAFCLLASTWFPDWNVKLLLLLQVTLSGEKAFRLPRGEGRGTLDVPPWRAASFLWLLPWSLPLNSGHLKNQKPSLPFLYPQCLWWCLVHNRTQSITVKWMTSRWEKSHK